jgi:hypothetical protein
MLMKKYLILFIVSFTGLTFAGSLPTKQVASDAKWVLHLDVDGLRKTQLGGFVFNEIISKELSKKLAELNKDPQKPAMAFDAQKITAIQSITAYGKGFEPDADPTGVLLIQTDGHIQPLIDALLQSMGQVVGAESEPPAQKVEQGNSPLYKFGNDMFAATHGKNLLLFGKSRKQVEAAREIAAGRTAGLGVENAFSSYPAAPTGFFFLAVAQGFNESKHLPPQAKVLQMADGVRLVLGENTEKLFANLALKTKTVEASTQIQQIAVGMVALLALSQSQDQTIMQLAQALKVTSKENIVTIGIEYPSAKAQEAISGLMGIGPKAKKPSSAAEKNE